MTYGYDGLMRQTTMTHPRTGATTTTYNALGQVESVEDADTNVTTYAYYDDTSISAGRLKSQTNALNKTQYFEYNARGEQLRTWGETAYPVEYVYDDLGRRTGLPPYRDPSCGFRSPQPARGSAPGTPSAATGR